jgi:hypothetical protein
MKIDEENAERSESDWHLTSNAERPIARRTAVDLGRRISNRIVSLILSFVVTAAAQSKRINQEGRILGPAPVVRTPTLFNTPQADAIVSAMQIFPATNPWNEVMALGSGSGYKIPHQARTPFDDLNGP